MKLIVAFVLLLMNAIAWAAPQLTAQNEILEETSKLDSQRIEDVVLDDNGKFSVKFVDDDGTVLQEEGFIVEDESTGAFRVIVNTGYYSYTAENGEPVELLYDAKNPGDVVINE